MAQIPARLQSKEYDAPPADVQAGVIRSRVESVRGSLASVAAIVRDRASDWSEFLADPSFKDGAQELRADIEALQSLFLGNEDEPIASSKANTQSPALGAQEGGAAAAKKPGK